ncbi:MAG: glycerol-3-phosphate dehydrogenase [Afipia sp.]|nr:glycerol-3-phosphate dehydrogenase [Afipia sp.]
MADFDIAIIGGGLNGVGVARDAAGRGLKVILLEQNDLGGAAASSSPHLLHGNFIDLEQGAALRVRQALAERDIMLRSAPHLVRPKRFVLPVHEAERPPAMLKAGTYVYDRLASGGPHKKSETLDLTIHEMGHPLKRAFGLAFEYSDCTVDENRLVVLNARDAADHGATIWTGARCARADRSEVWKLAVINRGNREIVTSRALVNATGAWTARTAATVLQLPGVQASLSRTSQIVVKRMFDHDNVYAFQNDDKRVIHAIPFERDFTLIGRVERKFSGDPDTVSVAADDVSYLCKAVNRYFRERIEPADVVHAMSGLNVQVDGPLKTRWRRDGYLNLDRKFGEAPLLTMFGGTTTTARRRAEVAMTRLAPFFLGESNWTADAKIPGGDFDYSKFNAELDKAWQRWPFLGGRHAQRLLAAYGTRMEAILGNAKIMSDLGSVFGEDLTGAEVRYLMAHEWARFPDDILWRRSKLGLTMPAKDREALAAFMSQATVAAA